VEINLSNTVQIITIVGFAAAVVKYLIVLPLQVSINQLQKSIEKMEIVLSHLADEQRCFDKRLVAVEESAKSAHRRLDGMDGR